MTIKNDFACHASKGRTGRIEIKCHYGAYICVYLICELYYMLNLIAGKLQDPYAVLIRGLKECFFPDGLICQLGIDKTY